eukprot:495099-Hanusia_phi.AAC.1
MIQLASGNSEPRRLGDSGSPYGRPATVPGPGPATPGPYDAEPDRHPSQSCDPALVCVADCPRSVISGT